MKTFKEMTGAELLSAYNSMAETPRKAKFATLAE